jgi:peptidyl-tRNA hydrolase
VDPAAYVLSSFNPTEKPQLEKVIDQATDALRVMLLEGLQTAMNRFQKKNRTEEG